METQIIHLHLLNESEESLSNRHHVRNKTPRLNGMGCNDHQHIGIQSLVRSCNRIPLLVNVTPSLIGCSFYFGICKPILSAACATSLLPRPERFIVFSIARLIRRATRSNTRSSSRPSELQHHAIPDRCEQSRLAMWRELD